MDQYIVSARKYRPSTFDSVVGQSALTSTLKNAIASDRLAHAYLFCGSRGVGKTSCARIFAKTINCLNRTPKGEACNECDSCRSFNEGNSMNIVELDAASHNGIDDMKSIIEQVQIPPTRGRYRVFIIDEVHMLSNAAFNAFLKTLEEPPSYVIFILATTEKHKIIPTILSRCQIYDFSRITISDMTAHLSRVAQAEGISAAPEALNVIARQADGAMRDALSIFDQVAASCRGNITYDATIASLNVLDTAYYSQIVDACVEGNIPQAIATFNEIRRKGFDAQFFINGLGEHLRDLMLASSPATAQLVDAPADVRNSLQLQAQRLKPDFIYAAMSLCNDADLNYRQSSNKQLLVEITLIKIAQLLSPPPAKSGQGGGPTLKPITAAATQTTPAAAQPVQQPAQPVQQPAPTVQRPAAKPAAPVPQPAAAPRQPGGAMRLGSMSMHTSRTVETVATTVRSDGFTPDDVASAWQQYADAHRSEPAVSNAMKKFSPRPTDNPAVWKLTVDSTVTANLLAGELDKLMPHMRNSLKNDSFTLNIDVNAGTMGPEYWSDTQVLANLMQQQQFADFYKLMHLTMR